MIKYIKNICIFFIIVAIIDVAFGKVCFYLNSHAKGGDTQRHYHIAKGCNEDILIFGSSRACHHYIPALLSDSLNVSVYNCGVDGNGILLFYSYMRMILGYHTPKVVIYDISSGFDMGKDDFTKYLGWQKRFYNEPGVNEVFNDVSPMEKCKMISSLYRYNGDWIQMLSDNIAPKQLVLDGGYKPIYRSMDYEPETQETEPKPTPWDETKKKFFKKFYSICREKGITFIVAYSPFYKASSSIQYQEMTQFCQENNIPLWDYYADPCFSLNRDFFADTSHMNDKGAREYTKMIVERLKSENILRCKKLDEE